MAIKRASDPTAVIEPGKFIASDSILLYGFAGKSGVVTRVAGKRVYYDRIAPKFEGDWSTHINADKVAFVCDTEAEVASLVALSLDCSLRTRAAIEEVERSYAEQSKRLLSDLIGLVEVKA